MSNANSNIDVNVTASNPITGGCYCGLNKYTISSQPLTFRLCHCITCRRLTGAPFLPFIGAPITAFTWTTSSPSKKTLTLSKAASRTFCSDCGTQLTMEFDGRDYVAVTAGSVDSAFDGVLAGVFRQDAYACSGQIFVSQIPEWGSFREWEGDDVPKYGRFQPTAPDDIEDLVA